MVEHLLSPDVLAKATLRGNEYAWPLAYVEAAIEDGRRRGLAVVGGQAQFRLPGAGTYEFYWIDVDTSDRQTDEPWPAYVDRSAAEALEKFRHHMTTVDWAKLIGEWPGQGRDELLAADAASHICFVLYFDSDASGVPAAG